MKKISWLHLTDLHFGHKGIEDTWPTIKNNFFRDLENTCKEGLDFVAFTGDFVFSGKECEYEGLNLFLKEMWECFNALGCNPYLLAVPGNHDLQRPDKLHAAAKMMLQLESDEEVKKEFWNDSRSEYYELVYSLFKNYCDWYKNLDIPTPNIVQGYLPGDFSTVFDVNQMKIGVVGLNSAFVHFLNDINEVFLSPKQLNMVTGNNPDDWAKNVDMAMLMTHHPYSWLSESCKDSYDSFIYTNNRFYGHFCGHMHSAYDRDQSEGGGEIRRLKQGVALFGLEKTGSGENRRHGYSHYTFIKDDDGVREILTPRSALRQQDGAWMLMPNNTFPLNANNQVIRSIRLSSVKKEAGGLSEKESTRGEVRDIKDLNNTNLVNYLEVTALRHLEWRLPMPQERHQRIRGGEMAQAQRFLSESRMLWVEADWGMGKEDFLGVLFDKLTRIKQDTFIFRFDCDGLYDIEGFYRGFEEQFGFELQVFLASINESYSVYIVCDNIDNALIEECGEELERILSIIKDYSIRVHIICTSRYKNDFFTQTSVKLQPLLSYEIKAYVEGHNDFTRDLLAEDCLDIIQVKSSGIPMIIDRIVSALSVISVEELSDFELDISNAGNNIESVPVSLKLAVKTFSDSSDSVYSSGYKLLKVLALIPYGECLKKIRYIDRRHPIGISCVINLQHLSLVTSSPMLMYSQSGEILSDIDTSERILKVPKQVRDYIFSCMSDDEIDSLIYGIADILFGKNWRSGKVKIIDSKFVGSRGARGFGPGNEHEVVKLLLHKAIREDDIPSVDTALGISVSYCIGLDNCNRYRDILFVSSEILPLISGRNSNYSIKLMILRAKALRMLSRYDEALKIFQDLLSGKWKLTNKERIQIFLNIALTYKSLKKMESAKEWALKVVDSNCGKGQKIHAQSIICEIEGGSIEEMNRLEGQARANKSLIVANNIAYSMACANNTATSYKMFDKILNSSGDVYNKVKAASKKTILAFKNMNKSIIGKKEEAILAYGYSLYYNQRIKGVFKDCHEALWLIYENEKSIEKLLRIFRLSSLLWRLLDKTSSEVSYLEKLSQLLKNCDFVDSYDIDCAYFNSRESHYEK